MNVTKVKSISKPAFALLALGALSAMAYAGSNDVAGLQLAGDAMDQFSAKANKTFSLIVMISTWIIFLLAIALTVFFHGKAKNKMEQQQGDETGSAFMLWVKVAGVGILSLIMAGLVVFILWGRIVPIKGSSADYGTVVKAALTGNTGDVKESEVKSIGN